MYIHVHVDICSWLYKHISVNMRLIWLNKISFRTKCIISSPSSCDMCDTATTEKKIEKNIKFIRLTHSNVKLTNAKLTHVAVYSGSLSPCTLRHTFFKFSTVTLCHCACVCATVDYIFPPNAVIRSS